MIRGRARLAAGFTIVETLIVIAVTMFVFISAAALINGRERQTSFNQAIRAIQQDLQQTSATISSGNYISNGQIKCERGTRPTFSTGGNGQGTNEGCIFLGKIIQFNVGNTDPQVYNTYTLVGLRSEADTNVLNLATVKATLVPSQFDSGTLQYGLKAVWMESNGTPVSAAGFASNLTSLGTDDKSQPVSSIGISNTGTVAGGLSKDAGIAQINDNLATAAIDKKIEICFASAGTDQSTLLNFGGANSQTDIGSKTFTGRKCGRP